MKAETLDIETINIKYERSSLCPAYYESCMYYDNITAVECSLGLTTHIKFSEHDKLSCGLCPFTQSRV